MMIRLSQMNSDRWNNNEYVWAQKYRPKHIKDCILPQYIKSMAEEIIKTGDIGNYIFSGPPGTGKTTLALALANELGCDYLHLNGSGEHRGIDSVRNEVSKFAATSSMFSNKRKLIIYDEGDNLVSDAQMALREKIERVSKTCSFIITANYPGKLLEPIKSRCKIIEFKVPDKDEQFELTKQMLNRCIEILNENKIQYDAKIVAKIVSKYIPDNRKILNTLQNAVINGKISSDVLSHEISSGSFKDIINILKEKKWSVMNEYIEKNITTDSLDVILYLANNIEFLSKDDMSRPQGLLILNKYQTDMAVVADQKICLKACLTELIMNCTFT